MLKPKISRKEEPFVVPDKLEANFGKDCQVVEIGANRLLGISTRNKRIQLFLTDIQ